MLQNKDNLSKKELTIHTLGPSGTNCEAAANNYLEKKKAKGKICLHETLEKAVSEIEHDENSLLLGCVVYPELHTLVFSNLKNGAQMVLVLVQVSLIPRSPMFHLMIENILFSSLRFYVLTGQHQEGISSNVFSRYVKNLMNVKI